ncbi:MAG: hypothetical protein JO031_16505 [Ktedonobacteraceae bacterium]|nr:hypothetical protein [Ktedonobacteraceae bacterium]
MTSESASIVYDLGHHLLEVTATQTFLLTAHPGDDGAVPELVQLDHDEAYKLLITLQMMFSPIAE